MKKINKLIRIVINSLVHPSHLKVIIRDILKIRQPIKSDEIHLSAAMDWLKKSQDVSKYGGCSGVYTFEKGWSEPYPETTGYIIPTFIDYGELASDQDFIDRAERLGDWEINIQLPSGAVRGGVGINDYPIVFNTGQVIIGWIALYKKTLKQKYLDASIKACDWLVSNMDSDGKWSKNTYNGIPHSYNVRVAWPLLEVGIITSNSSYINSAKKNIRWVLDQSNENSWFNYMGFNNENNPLTHTIAYTLRGLLECAILLNQADVKDEIKDEILNHVYKASNHILTLINRRDKRFLNGTLDANWESKDSFSCLTGNAQLSIIFMKLNLLKKNNDFATAAAKNLDQLKSTQDLKSINRGINGGIAGSYPIWGNYVNFGYPNWAVKFFADGLMLKKTIRM